MLHLLCKPWLASTHLAAEKHRKVEFQGPTTWNHTSVATIASALWKVERIGTAELC